MPRFSRASEAQIATLHPKLQAVLRIAIQHIDFTVVEGFRNQQDQDAAYARNASQVKWPNGNHNDSPSRAVDITPYPVDWSESPEQAERLAYLAGFVMCISRMAGIDLRWGGDWDEDDDTRDENFRDRYHLELAASEA